MRLFHIPVISTILIFLLVVLCLAVDINPDEYGQWTGETPETWPQITLINQIKYTDTYHPIAGCAFLLDIGKDTVAVTAKHVLKFFKSGSMKAVSFNNTLELWKMFPKDNPNDIVIIDRLINENKKESLEKIPPDKDWILFTIKEKPNNIQPLKVRNTIIQSGEPVYIIGWRYSDKDCSQVIYEGNFVEADNGTILITTKKLSDNTMPGLSGSPVIDANGYLIGLMSQKAGKMERLSSVDYPKAIFKKTNK